MEISAIASQGLEAAMGLFDRAASQISVASPATGDITDLSQAAVALLSAKNDFAGNLTVMNVADEMERTTIDMLA